MKSKRAARRTAGLLLCPPVVFCLFSRPGLSSVPLASWPVRVTITSRGEYGLEGRTQASGRYEMTFVWTGRLENDGEDFLLLHDRCSLEKWEAQERSNGPDGIRLLTTGDFDERPELKVNYFLKTGGSLRLDFIIRGFPVPRSAPEDAFYLHLPTSAENNDREDGLNYNVFVVKGSNSITLDEADFTPSGAKKTFHWTWRHQTGVQKADRNLFEMSRHEAEVTIVILAPKRPSSAVRQARG